MNIAPTVAHFVWLPAPQGCRISPWGGPAAKLAPTLTHFVWLPGRAEARGLRLFALSDSAQQTRSRRAQPQGGRISPWERPGGETTRLSSLDL